LRKQFEQCLIRVCHGITRREIQVCAAIAVGMSSAAIALTLNISLNTVLTYRKRAYSRLNICSQNELMRLLYTHLSGTQHSIQ
jgi:DNA-binding CsgD family transcriptional regulator